ncbi:MAG: hypothetical protein J2P57_21465, partial [Acidimicrobiaceae bacterium]|nr:hypothetical protein [Acidimicrobiaceae bacterium]
TGCTLTETPFWSPKLLAKGASTGARCASVQITRSALPRAGAPLDEAEAEAEGDAELEAEGDADLPALVVFPPARESLLQLLTTNAAATAANTLSNAGRESLAITSAPGKTTTVRASDGAEHNHDARKLQEFA